VGSRSGSLALVRLSSENVVLAWTDAERGHYVVRAAPAVSAATQPTTLLSDPSGQAVLADLAPGPAREAIAVWSAPPPGHGFDPSRSELWTARTSIEPHNRLAFRAPERITAPGPNVDARVAVDPANDRAVAAWRTQGTHAGIRYAASLGLAGYSPRRPAAALRPKVAGTHWLRIALAAIAAAAALSLAAAAMWRARRRREP
jgi:hypothetical protein